MEINFKGKKRSYNLSTSDKQYTLSEIVVAKDGKNKGDKIFSPIGYFSQIENAINRVVHLEIHDSDVDNFNALLTAITDIKKWIGVLVSENFKLADFMPKN